MTRRDGRHPGDLRPVSFQRHFTEAPGSVLASFGRTRILCTATAVDGVPPFLQGKGRGWLTAEYAMHPASTEPRKQRERNGRLDGRSVEIQRLIARSLRAVVDLGCLGERTIWVDCDVLQADGGTRTAAISAAWVALSDLFGALDKKRALREWPLTSRLAAISVGVVEDEVLCDLDYSEDSRAEVDLNLVMDGEGRFVEVQGTSEGRPFDRERLDRMLECGAAAIRRLFEIQQAALESR